MHRRVLISLAVALVLAASGAPAVADNGNGLGAKLKALWGRVAGDGLPDDIVVTNGRIEAEQVLVAAKFAGTVRRVVSIRSKTRCKIIDLVCWPVQLGIIRGTQIV